MKNLAIVIAFAAVLSTLIPQAAQAQFYGYGIDQSNYGGATVYSDGSFSNNGVSWNGADPSGGATGIRTGAWGAPAAYNNPNAGGATGLLPPQPRAVRVGGFRVVRARRLVF